MDAGVERKMTGFDRRTVVKGALATSAALAVPSGVWAAEQRAGVFVVDRRFAASARAALERGRSGMTVIDPRDEDLGIAWRKRIPDLLEQNGGHLEGITLWSDYLICRTFARSCGHGLMERSEPVALGAAELLHWQLK